MLAGLEVPQGGRPVGGGAPGHVSGAPCVEVMKLPGPTSHLELGSHPAGPWGSRGACRRTSAHGSSEGLNGQFRGRAQAKEGR